MPDTIDTPILPCQHVSDITQLKTDVAEIKGRLDKVESIGDDVSAILSGLDKVTRQLKFWAPAIISAAVSAGIVNGKLGAFLHALLNGAH